MRATRAGARGVELLLAALLCCALLATPALALSSRVPVLPSPSVDNVAPTFGPNDPVAQVTAWLESALALRTTALSSLGEQVADASSLTLTDRAALTSVLQSTNSAIAALTQKAPTDTTLLELHDDAAAMIGYHVLVLLTPEVSRVLVVDGELAEYRMLSQQETVLEAAITAAQQAKRDVREVEDYGHDLQSRLTDVENLLGGLSATLLALNPVTWPAPLSTLQSAAAATNRSASDLVSANGDITAIVRLLAHPVSKGASIRK